MTVMGTTSKTIAAQINEVISKRSSDRWQVRVRHISTNPDAIPGVDFYTTKCNYYTKRDAVAAVKQHLNAGAILTHGVVQVTHN